MTKEDSETQFTLRCSVSMRKEAENLAEKKGQSLAAWLRRAVQNEIDRETGVQSEDTLTEGMQEQVRRILRAELDRMEKGE